MKKYPKGCYTIGIRKRFWPFSKKYRVYAHMWDNLRLIIDTVDGYQIHFPELAIFSVKVYPDIRKAIDSLKMQTVVEKAPPRDFVESMAQIAEDRANARVRGILQSEDESGRS